MKKRSFFERLSGSAPLGDDYETFEDEYPVHPTTPARTVTPNAPMASLQSSSRSPLQSVEEDSAEGQLPVDVYQNANEIVIRTFVAGVRADELNVSISRDMVVIEGSRDEREQIGDSDYFTRELFWGSFARTILLPQEIDVDTATATAKDGLLTLTLPKLDKARQTKMRIKMG